LPRSSAAGSSLAFAEAMYSSATSWNGLLAPLRLRSASSCAFASNSNAAAVAAATRCFAVFSVLGSNSKRENLRMV